MTSLEIEDEEVDVIMALSYLEKQASRHVAIVLKCYKVSRWKIAWQMLTLKSLSYLAWKLCPVKYWSKCIYVPVKTATWHWVYKAGISKETRNVVWSIANVSTIYGQSQDGYAGDLATWIRLGWRVPGWVEEEVSRLVPWTTRTVLCWSAEMLPCDRATLCGYIHAHDDRCFTVGLCSSQLRLALIWRWRNNCAVCSSKS